MVAYSFKKRFTPKILAGTKPGTIRADRKRHARPGEQLQLYQSMRTKSCALIMRVPCRIVLPISISLGNAIDAPEIIRAGEKMDDINAFAVQDGFEDWDDMARFWREEHPDVRRFDGQNILWSPELGADGMKQV